MRRALLLLLLLLRARRPRHRVRRVPLHKLTARQSLCAMGRRSRLHRSGRAADISRRRRRLRDGPPALLLHLRLQLLLLEDVHLAVGGAGRPAGGRAGRVARSGRMSEGAREVHRRRLMRPCKVDDERIPLRSHGLEGRAWSVARCRLCGAEVAHLDVSVCVRVARTHFLGAGDEDIPKHGPPPAEEGIHVSSWSR